MAEKTHIECPLPLVGSSLEWERTPGLHLTDVIKDLAERAGISKTKPSKWGRQETIAPGFIWEDVFTEVFGRLMGERLGVRIGEVELDGIIMTPDGFDFQEWTLVEFKFTWKSSRKDPLEDWYWMTQLKSYCKATNTQLCRLHVFHVMGDYLGSGPKYLCWQIRFEPHEIETTWAMIKNHAAKMLEEYGKNGKGEGGHPQTT